MNGKYASGTNANEKVGGTNAIYWLQAQIQICLHPIIIQWKEPSLALHLIIFFNTLFHSDVNTEKKYFLLLYGVFKNRLGKLFL